MNKKILTLFFLLIIIPSLSWGNGNWSFDNEKNITYSIFETIDAAQWHTFIVCQVNPSEIIFEALIPFSEYKKHYTFKLPTQLKYKGMNLVRHDTFFWGEEKSPVEVSIDSKKINGFVRISGYQVSYKGDRINNVIKKLKKANILKIGKHFWDNNNKKRYPEFSLIGFTNSFAKINLNKDSNLHKTYSLSGLRCKKRGARKIIWINTSHGSYALNGQAIEWVQSVERTGSPLLGSDGKPMKIGRNHIPPNKLSKLIEEGLKLCF